MFQDHPIPSRQLTTTPTTPTIIQLATINHLLTSAFPLQDTLPLLHIIPVKHLHLIPPIHLLKHTCMMNIMRTGGEKTGDTGIIIEIGMINTMTEEEDIGQEVMKEETNIIETGTKIDMREDTAEKETEIEGRAETGDMVAEKDTEVAAEVEKDMAVKKEVEVCRETRRDMEVWRGPGLEI